MSEKRELLDLDQIEDICGTIRVTIDGSIRSFLYDTPTLDALIANQKLDKRIVDGSKPMPDGSENPNKIDGIDATMERLRILLPSMTEEQMRKIPFPKIFEIASFLVNKVNEAVALVNPTARVQEAEKLLAEAKAALESPPASSP
jgi:hypothetical protein